MNHRELAFNLTDTIEARAAAQIIRQLNEVGVPLTLSNDGPTLLLVIHEGY